MILIGSKGMMIKKTEGTDPVKFPAEVFLGVQGAKVTLLRADLASKSQTLFQYEKVSEVL